MNANAWDFVLLLFLFFFMFASLFSQHNLIKYTFGVQPTVSHQSNYTKIGLHGKNDCDDSLWSDMKQKSEEYQ